MNDFVGHVVEKYSDHGSQEPWVARVWMGPLDVINKSDLSEFEKKESVHAVFELAEELDHAFTALEALRAEPKTKPSILTTKKYYSDFYTHLWRAYKDRFQSLCNKIGFNIGFLFKIDKEFEKSSLDFIKKNPKISDNFRLMLKHDKAEWQNGLAQFRNEFIEHKKTSRNIEELFYRVDSAENIFENVWTTIEEVLAFLLSSKLSPPLALAELPEADRDPSCPTRFVVGLDRESFEKLQKTLSK